MKVIPQKGYTDKESAQIAAVVQASLNDPRSWQERVLANADTAFRMASAKYEAGLALYRAGKMDDASFCALRATMDAKLAEWEGLFQQLNPNC